MTFEELLDQAIDMLRRRGRVTYRALKLQFQLDDDTLGVLKDELIYGQQLAVDEEGRVVVWAGPPTTPAAASIPPLATQEAHLDQAASVEDVPATASGHVSHIPEAERRQLTVLFCDLVDSTVLASQLDPEDLREVVRAYQDTCARVIARFEGHIAQYLGDGLLVYFGYPLAHEDDAQRAVRAGLGIVEALGQLNTHLGQERGVHLAVRLGIHTGLVVVGDVGGGSRQEQLALGETPNLAARLQGLAAPDTVVVSPATFRLVRGYFTAQELDAHSLKGITAPVQVYRMLGESAAQSRLDIAGPSGLTPLVGRESEVLLLLERWAHSQDGRGQVVLLSGEAGIGKSRLVEVLREHVISQGATRMVFRCSPYHQQSALYPVIDHLQRFLHWDSTDAPEARLAALEQALRTSRLPLEEVTPLLAALLSLPHPAHYPLLNLTPQRQRQKTHDALVAWLLEEVEQQPVLAVWEDLHWADPSTLELLGLVLDQIPTARMLTLLTCRPEFHPSWASRSHLTQLTLTRLGRPQVEALITSLTGGKALPAAVAEQVVAKTDGVPLFVEELVKMLLESGLVRVEGNHYGLTGPLPPLAIPATLHDSLMARLDRLATVKEVAQLGAVLGREFPYALLQAVSPRDEATVQQGLRQLVAAELVYQRGIPPQATYTFKHALIQEAAYQSLLKSTRQHHHQRIAQVLATHFPALVETQPELLASHYTAAGLAGQAIPHWQRAGERATARSANVEAISHLTTALELLQTLPDTPERVQHELGVQTTLGPVLMAIRGWAAPEVEATYARARALCQQVGDTPQRFPALMGIGTFYMASGQLQTAHELREQLLSLAHRQQEPLLLMHAHLALGAILLWLGAVAPARVHLEQGIRLYEQHPSHAPSFVGDNPGVSGRRLVALALWCLGYPEQALRRSHEALTLAQDLSHPFSLAFALSQAAHLHHFRREALAVHERAEAVRALARAQGFSRWDAFGTSLGGWALAVQGQRDEGIAQLRQGLAAWQAAGQALGQLSMLALLAETYGQAGQAEAGLRVLAEAPALMDTTGERFQEAEVWRLQGELLLAQAGAQPQGQEAEACFQQALAVARHQQAKSWELRAAMSLSRLWQHQGKRQEAYDLLAPIYHWFTEGFDTADLQEARALLEALSE